MKKLWLVLLSSGLIIAFSTSVFAIDVKFSGSYYAAGLYLSRTTLNDDSASNGPSTAFYAQRLRLSSQFIVAPGLSVVTRADILERVWGASRSTPNTTLDTSSQGTKAENENIAFDCAYLQYNNPLGMLRVGPQPAGKWGTDFADTSAPVFRLALFSSNFFAPGDGALSWVVAVHKTAENSYTANKTTATQADNDNDVYLGGIIYNTRNFNTGLLYVYYNWASTRDNTATSYKRKSHALQPYIKAKIGPVYIQAELDYALGNQKQYDDPGNSDVKYESLAGFLDAVATFGPVYIGGTFAYVQGDKTETATTNEGAWNGGLDWNPTLLMWNEERSYWVGSIGTAAGSFGTAGMSNAWLYQIRGGVRPTDKLDIMASLTYANADVTPSGYVSKNYGYEIDVTGTYKITSNLSYMLGVGYLITGDYFKGTNSNNKIANDYLVINKLTLTF